MKVYKNDIPHFSLFSCGAFMDIGSDRAGLRTVGAVDIDPWALAAHRLNLPDVPVAQADLVKTSPTEVLGRLEVEQCDVLTSTPPCQCWTTANGKSGLEHDIRRFCLPVVAHYSAILKPRIVLLENVLGLQHKGAGPIWLNALEDEFRDQGYKVVRWVVNAKDFGAPQNRERLIVVAHRDCPEPIQPSPTVDCPRTFSEAMEGLTEEAALAEGCLPMSANWQEAYANVSEGVSPAPGKVYPRQRSDEPSAPLRTAPCVMTCPIHVHPTKNRFFTVVEYTRLQGEPNYKFPVGMPLKKKYLIIGEGNPPVVAEAIGRSVIQALSSTAFTFNAGTALKAKVQGVQAPCTVTVNVAQVVGQLRAVVDGRLRCRPGGATWKRRVPDSMSPVKAGFINDWRPMVRAS